MVEATKPVQINDSLQRGVKDAQDYGCHSSDNTCRPNWQQAAQEAVDEAQLSQLEAQQLFSVLGMNTAMYAAANECRGLFGKSKDATAWNKCYSQAAKGAETGKGIIEMEWKEPGATGAKILSVPAWLKEMAKLLAKGGVGAAEQAARYAKLFPAELEKYLELIKDNQKLVQIILRLYHQALENQKVDEMVDENAAAGVAKKIGNDIVMWGQLEGSKATDLDLYYVKGVAPQGDELKVDIQRPPDALFDATALNLDPKTAKDPAVMAQLARLFHEALMSFRAQHGQGEDVDAIAKQVAAAVGAEIKDKKLEADPPIALVIGLKAREARSHLDGAKKLKAVSLSPRALGEIPDNVRDEFIRGVEDPKELAYLQLALLDFWNNRVGAKYFKDLPKDQQDAFAAGLAKNLADTKRYPEDVYARAHRLALTIVRRPTEEGGFDMKVAPGTLFVQFEETWRNIGFYGHLRKLYLQALQKAKDEKIEGHTPESIGMELRKRVQQFLNRTDYASLPPDAKPEPNRTEPQEEVLAAFLKTSIQGIGADGKPVALTKAFDDGRRLLPLAMQDEKPDQERKLPVEFSGSVKNVLKVPLTPGKQLDPEDPTKEINKPPVGDELSVAGTLEWEAIDKTLVIAINAALKAVANPSLLSDPEYELLFRKAADQYGISIEDLSLLVKYYVDKDQHHAVNATGAVISAIGALDPLVGAMISYAYSSPAGAKGLEEVGDWNFNVGVAFGQPMSPIMLDSNFDGKVKLQKPSLDLRSGFSVMVDKKTSATISGNVQSRTTFDKKVQQQFAFGINAKLTPTTEDKKYKAPISMGIGATTNFDDSTAFSASLAIDSLWNVSGKHYLGFGIGMSYGVANDYMFRADPTKDALPGSSRNVVPGANNLTGVIGPRYSYNDALMLGADIGFLRDFAFKTWSPMFGFTIEARF